MCLLNSDSIHISQVREVIPGYCLLPSSGNGQQSVSPIDLAVGIASGIVQLQVHGGLDALGTSGVQYLKMIPLPCRYLIPN